MSQKFPIIERYPVVFLLAANAGALDAYTYVNHGGVFAGMQTGNMILMGVSAGHGNLGALIAHLIPFLVFAIGTVIVRSLQHALHTPEEKRRRALLVLAFELFAVILAALVAPYVPDIITTAIVAVAAAAQLQEFRRLHGKPFVSIMMTGNLRTAAEGLFDWFVRGDRNQLHAARDAGSAILCLILGAATSGLASHFLGNLGIISAIPILIATAIYVARAETMPF